MSEIIVENYDRVSEIISPFTGVEFANSFALDAAAKRGTAVHNYIEASLKGWNWCMVPNTIEPYYKCFMKWAKTQEWFGSSNLVLEKRLYDNENNITGQIDMMITLDGVTHLYDWKTSSFESPKSWALQGAAYLHLCDINGIVNPLPVKFVHLSQKKEATVYEYKDPQNKEIFFKCLELYRYFDMKYTRKIRI